MTAVMHQLVFRVSRRLYLSGVVTKPKRRSRPAP